MAKLANAWSYQPINKPLRGCEPVWDTGSNPVLTAKIKVMKEALKIIFLFKKPTWDDSRFVYIFFGIVGWLEVISILVGLIK